MKATRSVQLQESVVSLRGDEDGGPGRDQLPGSRPASVDEPAVAGAAHAPLLSLAVVRLVRSQFRLELPASMPLLRVRLADEIELGASVGELLLQKPRLLTRPLESRLHFGEVAPRLRRVSPEELDHVYADGLR